MRLCLSFAAFFLWFGTTHAQRPRAGSDALLASLDAKAPGYAGIANQIWGLAEVGYQETKSSALLQEQLKSAGFQVRVGVAGMPTAFVATFGSGQPVIVILGSTTRCRVFPRMRSRPEKSFSMPGRVTAAVTTFSERRRPPRPSP